MQKRELIRGRRYTRVVIRVRRYIRVNTVSGVSSAIPHIRGQQGHPWLGGVVGLSVIIQYCIQSNGRRTSEPIRP